MFKHFRVQDLRKENARSYYFVLAKDSFNILGYVHTVPSSGSRPSDKGGEGGPSHPDSEIRGVSKKFFPPFGPQFGSYLTST